MTVDGVKVDADVEQHQLHRYRIGITVDHAAVGVQDVITLS